MTNAIIEFFQSFTIPPEASIFFISLLPIMELRVGLIAASIMGIHWLKAFAICYIANIIPIPLILLFIKQIFKFLKRFNSFRGFITRLEEKALKKSGKVAKKQLLGLFLFVAVPLPGTGGWTGALIASLLNLDVKKSFAIIAAGVAAAGVIMLILSYFVPGLFGLNDIFKA